MVSSVEFSQPNVHQAKCLVFRGTLRHCKIITTRLIYHLTAGFVLILENDHRYGKVGKKFLKTVMLTWQCRCQLHCWLPMHLFIFSQFMIQSIWSSKFKKLESRSVLIIEEYIVYEISAIKSQFGHAFCSQRRTKCLEKSGKKKLFCPGEIWKTTARFLYEPCNSFTLGHVIKWIKPGINYGVIFFIKWPFVILYSVRQVLLLLHISVSLCCWLLNDAVHVAVKTAD